MAPQVGSNVLQYLIVTVVKMLIVSGNLLLVCYISITLIYILSHEDSFETYMS